MYLDDHFFCSAIVKWIERNKQRGMKKIIMKMKNMQKHDAIEVNFSKKKNEKWIAA